MKITKIQVLRCGPVEGGWRPVFCRIHTDAGYYGDGEAALSYGGATRAAFGMVQDLAGMLIGMDPMDHEVIWQKLYRKCFWGLNGGPVVFAGISCLDVALWDLKGKVYGAPLHQLLGGRQQTRLRAYASQLQNGWGTERKPARTPEEYAQQVRIAADQGFDAVKLNFLTFREDEGRYDAAEQTGFLSPAYRQTVEARIAAAREALGPKGELILENHCYTDVPSAIQVGQLAKQYGILYYEEPVTPYAPSLRQVYEQTGIPVASGERIYSRWQFARFLEEKAIQVVQPDIGTCGGITETKKICDMAYVHEAGVQIHVCGSPLITAASLQLESTLNNFVLHEYNVNTAMPKMTALTVYSYEPENGCMPVPDLPGIGNEISDEAFRGAEVETIS